MPDSTPREGAFRDRRPLSERFDLRYVRGRLWPYNWMRWLSFTLALAAGIYLAAVTLMGDRRVYSSGELTHAHAMFENRCEVCHQPDAHGESNGYWLPAADAACLKCHQAPTHSDPHADLYAGERGQVHDRLAPVLMSSNCAACHIEHRGRDHNLNAVDDRYCVQCHGDLDAYSARAARQAPASRRTAKEPSP